MQRPARPAPGAPQAPIIRRPRTVQRPARPAPGAPQAPTIRRPRTVLPPARPAPGAPQALIVGRPRTMLSMDPTLAARTLGASTDIATAALSGDDPAAVLSLVVRSAAELAEADLGLVMAQSDDGALTVEAA